jgi:hypothetical protein
LIVGNRGERLPRLLTELREQGVGDYEIWDGVYKHDSAVKNINEAHRQIVEYADVAGREMVMIAEDDLKFFGAGAWDYYIKNIPTDFDIYLSGIYMGDIAEDNTVKHFCGLHLYTVHKRFYQTFLSLPPAEHIDRAMKGLGKFVVCNPMIAEQYDGHSQNTGKDEKYRNLLNGRNIFGS